LEKNSFFFSCLVNWYEFF